MSDSPPTDASERARRRYLHLLATNHAALEDILARTTVGVAIFDREKRVVFINDVQAQYVGRPASQIIGQRLSDFADPAVLDDLERFIGRALQGTTTLDVVRDQDPKGPYGEPRRWRVSFHPVIEAGEVAAALVTFVNISPQWLSARSLALRSRLLDLLAPGALEDVGAFVERVCELALVGGQFASAWVGVVEGDRLRVAAYAGIELADLEEVTTRLRIDEADQYSHGPAARAALTGRPQVRNHFATAEDVRAWRAWAERHHVGAVAAFPIVADGRTHSVLTLYATEPEAFTDEMVAVLGEISLILSGALQRILDDERRRAAQTALERRDQMIEALTEGIVMIDVRTPTYPVVDVSASFTRLTGYPRDEVLGRSLSFLVGPESDVDQVDELRRAVREGRTASAEVLHYRRDGTRFWDNVSMTPIVDATERPSHYVAVLTDVTERRELVRQVLQSQKMEALGQLAAGIAHDFNNALLVIRGYGTLAAASADPTAAEAGRRIDAAVESAVTVVRRLFTLGEEPSRQLAPTDLNALVREALTPWAEARRSSVTLTLELAPELAPARIDRALVEQALLSLAANAHDAMPEGGALTVTTSEFEVTRSDARQRGLALAGPYVRVAVADNGHGMDSATLEHALEPFFTTRPHGTGLGLATVYGIATQCGGFVTISSEPGAGTRIDLHFPVAPPSDGERPASVAGRGGERILLVEDLVEARALLARALREEGYEVFEATNGAEALAVARDIGPIDLLVTDVVMPEMDGRTLAGALVGEQPDLRVVFTSGYPSEDGVRDDRLSGPTHFIAKPYLLSDMTRLVRDILAGGGA